MKTQFTPGPWESDCWIGTDAYEDLDSPFVKIGDTIWEPDKVDIPAALEQKANADLIAASPLLYEVLHNLVGRVATDAETYAPNGNEPIWAFIADASDALAKARGEQ